MSGELVPKKKPAGIKEIDELLRGVYAQHVEFGGLRSLLDDAPPFHPDCHDDQVDAIYSRAMHMTTLPMPRCAVCGRTVDRVTTLPRTGLRTTYIVECHGETEEVTLEDRDVLDAASITVGETFTASAKRRLTADGGGT
jgi:hypothetical protein